MAIESGDIDPKDDTVQTDTAPVHSQIDITKASDSEIGELYSSLKEEYTSEPSGKELFKVCKKNLKKAMEADKMRSVFGILRRVSVAVFVVVGAITFIKAREYDTITFPRIHPDENIIEYILRWIDGQIFDFRALVPSAEIYLGLLAIAFLAIVAFTILYSYDDHRILKRMMCHAMSESMTREDSVRFKTAFVSLKERIMFYGKTSVLRVKDAISFTPMMDYLSKHRM